MTRSVFRKFGRAAAALIFGAAMVFCGASAAVAGAGAGPSGYSSTTRGSGNNHSVSIAQDSNTWCQHVPGTGSSYGYDPYGPASVYDPQDMNYSAPYPQSWAGYAPLVLPVTMDCTGSSCLDPGLATPIDCSDGACTSTTDEGPCDCSAEEAAVQAAQEALDEATEEASTAQDDFDEALADSQAAAERENNLRAEEAALPHGSPEKAAKTAERKAARNERKAKVKVTEAARAARDDADAAVDDAQKALDDAQKALDDCRKDCPGGSAPSSTTGQPSAAASFIGRTGGYEPPDDNFTGGSTPSSTTTGQPATTTTETPSYLSTTVGIKLNVSVVMAAAAGQQAVAGQSLKALGPEFGLPPDCSSGCDESNKTDVAADQGPTQCTTGSDGSCDLDFAGADSTQLFGDGFESGDVTQWSTTLDGTPQVSNLVVVAGGLNGCPFSQAVCDQVTDQVQIGDNTHYTVGCPESQQEAVLDQIGQDPNVLYSEPNYCGEKKLPVPLQYSVPLVASPSAVDTAGRIGHAKITLSFGEARTGD